MSSSTSKPRVLHWYRTDLRVHDSPSLKAAQDLKPEALYPLWIWDPEYILNHRTGINRLHFLLESMNELSNSLTTINPLQRLVVLRGQPEKVLDWIFQNWGITHLVYEIDTCAYSRSRDESITKLAHKHNVTVLPILGHTLYSVPLILKNNAQKPTMTIQQWSKAASHLPSPSFPLPVPSQLFEIGEVTLPPLGFIGDEWMEKRDVNSKDEGGWREQRVTCFDEVERMKTGVPSLESLGIQEVNIQKMIPPGEKAALSRLNRLCNDKAWVASFAKPQSSPAVTPSDFMDGAMYRNESQGGIRGGEGQGGSTFVLSMFLKFGCLSVRTFYHETKRAIEEFKTLNPNSKNVQAEPENIIGQLKFREMYICAEYTTPNFSRIRGNKISRYIPWHCPTRYDENGLEIYPRPRDDEDAEKLLEAWTFGRTGFPWIDALMRQLRQTGWMHHLGRHSVACFLTRGQGYISWERGAEVFDELLLDWDPAANSGNWMWLSCSAFYSMYYRVYSPIAFPQKWDPTGQLVRRYCPELKDFPDKYIYEPHKAPLSVQRQANCLIPQMYPAPILSLPSAQKACQEGMKNAFLANLYGTSPAVLAGDGERVVRSTLASPKGEKKAEKRLDPFERARLASAAKKKRTG